MKIYRVEQPNGDFIETVVPDPVAKTGEVLVRIQASGVNPLDTKIRAGQAPHAQQPLPAVLGLDMAGVVEDVGEGVTAFRRGDEVFGMTGGVGGLQGSLAALVAADYRLLAHKPATLSMREAAALPLSTITAWEGLVDRAAVHEGQKVLIHAGAGGVGHIAVQIAKAFGAEVFATVSADKAAVVGGFGALPLTTGLSRVSSISQHSPAMKASTSSTTPLAGRPSTTPLRPCVAIPATYSAVSAGAPMHWRRFRSGEQPIPASSPFCPSSQARAANITERY